MKQPCQLSQYSFCEASHRTHHVKDMRLLVHSQRTMRQSGFTLLELVLVMVLLGALAAFSSAFLGQGAKVYVDAVARDRLMSEVRFGLERLNRELRDAVPGSVTLSSNGSCVQFWPIKAAAR